MKTNLNNAICLAGVAALAVLVISTGCGGEGAGTGISTNTTGGGTTGLASTTGSTGATTGSTTGSTTGTTTSSTTGSTAGTANYSYAASIVTETVAQPQFIAHGGDFIALGGSTFYFCPSLTSPNSAVVPIANPTGGLGDPTLINDSGQLAGYVSFGSTALPYYWTSPTATPIPLSVPAGFLIGSEAISNTGALACTMVNETSKTVTLNVYPTPAATPITLASYQTASPGISYVRISDAGIIVAGIEGQTPLMFKPPYTSAGTPLKMPDGTTPFAAEIGADGTVYGYNQSGAYFYNQGPSYSKPTLLAADCTILDINSKGAMCGFYNNGTAADDAAVIWPSPAAAPEKFTSIGLQGFQVMEAGYILDNGDLYVDSTTAKAAFAVPSLGVGTERKKAR